MDKFSKDQLVSAVAGQTGLTKKSVNEVIDSLLNTITAEITKGNSVRLGNSFGSFVAYTTKAVTKYNALSKTEIKVPSKQVVKFKPSAALKSAVNA